MSSSQRDASPATVFRFSLLPFDRDRSPTVNLSGSLCRQEELLQADFLLQGINQLRLPSPSPVPQRRHELWRQTCFELFFGDDGQEAYHEVNLSPSGDWNLYSFEAYRQGMREQNLAGLRYWLQPAVDSLSIRLAIDLARLDLQGKTLKVSPCAVLLSGEGLPSYWALAHPCPQPDFHDRKAWNIFA